MQIAAGINGNTNNNGQLTPLFVELCTKKTIKKIACIYSIEHIAYSIWPCHNNNNNNIRSSDHMQWGRKMYIHTNTPENLGV